MATSDTSSNVPPADALHLLELRRKRLLLEAEAARLEEEIALSQQRAAAPAPAPPVPPPVPRAIPLAPPIPPPAVVAPPPPAVPSPEKMATKSRGVAGTPGVPAAPVRDAGSKTSAPAKATIADAPPKKDEPKKADDEPRPVWSTPWFIRWHAVPSWLVSTAVHVVVVLALALATYPVLLEKPFQVVTGSIAEPVEELLTPAEVTVELDTKQTEIAAFVAAGDVGAADLGDAVAIPTGNESVSDVDVISVSTMSDLGQIFGSSGKGMAKIGDGLGGAEFFGVKASGRRFVFIVDSSNSMRGKKFEDACEELMYAIRRLNSDQFFYVMFFDQDAARMTFAPNKKPEASFARATPANIKLLDDWVKTVENELKTDPYDAVVFGMDLYPDAVYLLTDGKFTDKGATERYLRKRNIFDDPAEGRTVKVPVHCVGFYDRGGEETLQQIAKEHRGTYRFVAPPAGFVKK